MYEASNSRDYEVSTAMLHPEVELHQAAAIPDTDRCQVFLEEDGARRAAGIAD
jgi:hypothetical protein